MTLTAETIAQRMKAHQLWQDQETDRLTTQIILDLHKITPGRRFTRKHSDRKIVERMLTLASWRRK